MDLVEIYPWIKSAWTVWFFLLFAGIVAWAYRPGRTRANDAHARIPLNDEG